MSLDKATVAKIAHLARIHVPEQELESLAGDLSKIIDWVEQLAEVDTDDVAPMTSAVDLVLRWRADAVNDGGCADDGSFSRVDPYWPISVAAWRSGERAVPDGGVEGDLG